MGAGTGDGPPLRGRGILHGAMSQENVEVIREAFGRWNAGDIDFWIEHAQPDVEIRSKYATLEQGGAYRGHEGMREWMEEIHRNFAFFEVATERVHDLGDKVLVLGGVHFRGRASNTEIEYPFGWVCEMRDGKLSGMSFHSSHAEALEAAGLRE
jgi:ketosteroid isomerase-like protein